VIDNLRDRAKKEDRAVAWLYCDYNAQQEHTVINMMGAILKLLAGREIPDEIRKAFLEGTRPLFPSLMRILRTMIASLPQVFICIDALDELPASNIPELLESLREILQEFPKTRIFLTGRPHVMEAIQRYFVGAVVISIFPNLEEIRKYVSSRLREGFWLYSDMYLRTEIEEIIIQQQAGSSQWIALLVCRTTKNFYCTNKNIERRCN